MFSHTDLHVEYIPKTYPITQGNVEGAVISQLPEERQQFTEQSDVLTQVGHDVQHIEQY